MCWCSPSAPILRRVGLRRLAVRSGGAVRRPVPTTRQIPFLVAEWIVARASPSPTRDAFAIGDSNPSRKRGYDEARFRDHPLHVGSLPGGARRGQHFADAQVAHLFSEVSAEDDVPVAQQVAPELVEGKGLPQLLSRPLRGRVRGHVKVNNTTTVMGQNQKHV